MLFVYLGAYRSFNMACLCTLHLGVLICFGVASPPPGVVVSYDACQAAQNNLCDTMDMVASIETGPDVPDIIAGLLGDAYAQVNASCGAVEHRARVPRNTG